MTDALAVTADGEVFRGRSVGAEGMTTGEVVFNTSMSGYQEVFSDPSYAGQVVVMTSPHIGNYGVNDEDDQANAPAASGMIVRALSRRHSNWRATASLGDYLQEHGMVAMSEVDTRRLTRHIRSRGAQPVAMGAGISEGELVEAARRAPRMEGLALALDVSVGEPYRVEAAGTVKGHVVALDLGIKRDIVDRLCRLGHDVTVVPATMSAASILALGPSGVFLSNGPGDPEPLSGPIETVRALLGRTPVFGICLGHQVLGLALGGSTFKLPFGHHGGNHPVRRLSDGRIHVTAQNHGFAVDPWSLSGTRPPATQPGRHPWEVVLPARLDTRFGEVVPTHQNLNDGTLEGLRCLEVPAFGVQYHPEAAPGPHDALGLFEEFDALMDGG